ncbi:MAG: hypothetical protein ACPGJV_04000 [Bacteriovoracaceae bacterium]
MITEKLTGNFLENFKKNGIESKKEDFPFSSDPLKQFDQDQRLLEYKKKFALKAFLCILLTNILVALIIMPGEKTQITKKVVLKVPSHFTTLKLHLTNLTTLENSVNKVSINSTDGKLWIKEAYIHRADLQAEHDHIDHKGQYFEVSIPKKYLKKEIINKKNLLAFPYGVSKVFRKKSKKGDPYEIPY